MEDVVGRVTGSGKKEVFANFILLRSPSRGTEGFLDDKGLLPPSVAVWCCGSLEKLSNRCASSSLPVSHLFLLAFKNSTTFRIDFQPTKSLRLRTTFSFGQQKTDGREGDDESAPSLSRTRKMLIIAHRPSNKAQGALLKRGLIAPVSSHAKYWTHTHWFPGR